LNKKRQHGYIDPGTGVTFAAGIGAMVWGFIVLVVGAVGLTFKKWWGFFRNLVGSKKPRP
jgi:hypothetical protein